jgi:ABC-type transport system involved in multi-copper enzyme maturation permease subunit
LSLYRQWQDLKQNPVYLRETGAWGTPNPFYKQITRYSPFIIIGVISLGICGGSTNPALFASNEEMFAAACFICLPSFLLTAVTLYAQIMAPALTAPTISMERAAGTWDILRTTPLSMQSIFLAKLVGALSRLRIWLVLFALSLLQGGILACSVTFIGGENVWWGSIMGLATMLRPWLEIFFAAFAGMYASTLANSAMIALVAAYGTVILVKLFNSSGLWLAVSLLANLDDTATLLLPTLAPIVIYMLLITAVWLGLYQQAKKMRTE